MLEYLFNLGYKSQGVFFNSVIEKDMNSCSDILEFWLGMLNVEKILIILQLYIIS